MSRYLITFDMDTNCLKDNYHGNDYNNAYYDIRNTLEKHGFEHLQGSVYLGKEGISEAHGTIAIQDLTAKFDWFYPCVSNIKFYRIESDLNADFIAENVHKAKEAFKQQMKTLELTLINSGLDRAKIDEILNKQIFSLENRI
ncbi:VapD [Glaesserella parasuis]|uniref:VapD n=2 Tax=Glaesserella parasuis TaxID=738 RepID=A0A6I4QW53_GLAPU|nr:virulence-associated protein D [Glaesserella parasuis]AGO16903.1 virulence-associated protein D [Glaesserella parasuis ZJ0906]AMW16437.1 VapD [Glaesserella parasuis]ATW46217.1 VapD [Glaesserella parasuis str. Nagasaki]EPZ99913.1 CRISPR associated Cas2 family protein [Glaesserella parasuis str. Nagasaki]EYE72013.1 virulence-associated protein D [Glaesserella parasuis str. Nagasaki]